MHMVNRILFFCTAEGAKHLFKKATELDFRGSPDNFWLVESRKPPKKHDDLRHSIEDGEKFKTEWTGASVDDILQWFTTEKLSEVPWIDAEVIAIADEQSASDDTLVFMIMVGLSLKEDGGNIPPKEDEWYQFRVKYQSFGTVVTELVHTSMDVAFPIYFGRKDELTDENGVFDVDEAEKLVDERCAE